MSDSKGYVFHKMVYVYMIKNEYNRLYIGVSSDPVRRLRDHNAKRGALYTSVSNFQLVFLEEYPTFIEARAREVQLKKWRRDKKEMLIRLYSDNKSTKR